MKERTAMSRAQKLLRNFTERMGTGESDHDTALSHFGWNKGGGDSYSHDYHKGHEVQVNKGTGGWSHKNTTLSGKETVAHDTGAGTLRKHLIGFHKSYI